MTQYNKLVRDKIPQILDTKSVVYEKRTATEEEYKTELIKKLREELEEFEVAADVEELADIMEVVEALKLFPEYSDAEEVRIKKKEERGGFEERVIIKGEK